MKKNSLLIRVTLGALLLVSIFAVAFTAGATAQSSLSEGTARRLIARVAGIELPTSAVKIRQISTLGSAAMVEADVTTAFRFARGDNGDWRVAEIRIGQDRWENVEVLTAALNTQRRALAQSELETMATALEALRRERGFYVVADSQSVLMDHLAPRYLQRIIRLDPWQHFYEYTGTRERFRLRSVGADGRPDTPDDVVISKG